MKKKLMYSFKANSNFFNDICVGYQKNNLDMTIKDRRKYFYINVTICDSNCLYKSINYTSNCAICECEPQKEINTNKKENSNFLFFTKKEHNFNVHIEKCYLSFLEFDFFNNNIGFWFIIGCIIVQLLMVLSFSCGGMKTIASALYPYTWDNPPTRSQRHSSKKISTMASSNFDTNEIINFDTYDNTQTNH